MSRFPEINSCLRRISSGFLSNRFNLHKNEIIANGYRCGLLIPRKVRHEYLVEIFLSIISNLIDFSLILH